MTDNIQVLRRTDKTFDDDTNGQDLDETEMVLVLSEELVLRWCFVSRGVTESDTEWKFIKFSRRLTIFDSVLFLTSTYPPSLYVRNKPHRNTGLF